MATTSRTKKTKSAQQWAWEFLRRNPDYQDAFRKMHALSQEQKAQIGMMVAGNEGHQLDEEIVRSLDIEFFDTSDMTGYGDKQKTVGEYLDQSQRVREFLKEPEVHFSYSRKFRLETYSLATWYEPSDEWPENVVDTMWSHPTAIELGLEPAPWAEGFDFKSDDEDDEYMGWPLHEAEPIVKNKVDKRRRKSPLKSSTSLPLVQGTDGNIYQMPLIDLNLSLEQTQACVFIDLNLPIGFQLNQAKNFLEEHQEALVRGGFVQKLPKQADRFGAFDEYLKILDLLEAGASHLDIATELDGLVPRTVSWKRDHAFNQSHPVKRMTSRSKPDDSINELTQAVRKKIERAIHLRDYGYRALALSA